MLRARLACLRMAAGTNFDAPRLSPVSARQVLRPQPAEVVEKLPENRLRLREGVVKKKILTSDGASRWEPRLAVLAEDALLLSREGQNNVLDYVPLTQIDKVVVVTEMERTLGARSDLFSRKESGQDSSASVEVDRIASADSSHSGGHASGGKSFSGAKSFLPRTGGPVSVSSKTSHCDVFNIVTASGLVAAV